MLAPASCHRGRGGRVCSSIVSLEYVIIRETRASTTVICQVQGLLRSWVTIEVCSVRSFVVLRAMRFCGGAPARHVDAAVHVYRPPLPTPPPPLHSRRRRHHCQVHCQGWARARVHCGRSRECPPPVRGLLVFCCVTSWSGESSLWRRPPPPSVPPSPKMCRRPPPLRKVTPRQGRSGPRVWTGASSTLRMATTDCSYFYYWRIRKYLLFSCWYRYCLNVGVRVFRKWFVQGVRFAFWKSGKNASFRFLGVFFLCGICDAIR